MSKFRSATHPCIKCTINEDDRKDIKHESVKEEVVPMMCFSHKGRIVETIVKRMVDTINISDDLPEGK